MNGQEVCIAKTGEWYSNAVFLFSLVLSQCNSYFGMMSGSDNSGTGCLQLKVAVITVRILEPLRCLQIITNIGVI